MSKNDDVILNEEIDFPQVRCVGDEGEQFGLMSSDEALKILIRVRDETHRFGVTYHRKLRSKRVLTSELDGIKGIGEVRKTELLKRYGSVKKIKELTVNELKNILPEKVAIELLEKLKK